MKTTITFEIDTDSLNGFTDAYLAQLWHVGQANPAPTSDRDAGALADSIGREIISRWLKQTGPALCGHQGSNHYWNALAIGLNAKFKDGVWSIRTEADALSTTVIYGAGQATPCSVVVFRWGGGADPGKYHVFLSGAGMRAFLISIQCVVDDFGTLVDCKTGRPV